jgi:hypothetical protein
VFQLAVISEMTLAEPPALGEGPALADGPALGGTAGADCAVGCTCVGAAENDPCAFCGFCVELEPPGEQADIAATNSACRPPRSSASSSPRCSAAPLISNVSPPGRLVTNSLRAKGGGRGEDRRPSRQARDAAG